MINSHHSKSAIGNNSTAWIKRPKAAVVTKRNKFTLRQKFNNLFYKDFNGKNKENINKENKQKFFSPTLGVFAITLITASICVFVYTNYKNTNFSVNKLTYVDKKQLTSQVQSYLKDHNFFQINTKEFESDLKTNNALISSIYVNKSFFRGMILDVKEYQPIAVISFKGDGQQVFDEMVFYTDDKKLIPFYEISKPIVTLNYDKKIDQFESQDGFIRKSIIAVEKLTRMDIEGSYTFDNFGNFSILTTGNKSIRIDLKEKYFSLDDQLKVLQNALVQNANSSEYDMRFNYLVVKQ